MLWYYCRKATTVVLLRSADDIYAQTVRPELLVVQCCGLDESLASYRGQVAQSLVAVYLSPNVTTNWDESTGAHASNFTRNCVTSCLFAVPENVTVEREIVEPQFEELNPCPCDLNSGCDSNCCCDTVTRSNPNVHSIVLILYCICSGLHC